jgi:hypothetical protein
MSRLGRGFLVIIVGLALAFGVFYFTGWPSTLEVLGGGGDEVALGDAAPGELLNFGVGPVRVVGKREVNIHAVRLLDPSPGLELVSVRLSGIGPTENPSFGVTRGPQPDIERLPTASGSIMKGGTGGFLIVTVRATSPGSHRLRGLLVRYGTGWLTRSAGLGATASVRIPTPTPAPSS